MPEIKTPMHPKSPLPVGTLVVYQGIQPEYHGVYRITAHASRAELEASGRRVEDYFIDYTGYRLWPVGVQQNYRNRERALYFVRRGSFTELKMPVMTVAKGDVIQIVPESGPQRTMRVHHVEHHIITLNDIILEADSGA